MIIDPDQLYTAAIARVNMDPHLDAVLGAAPVAKVFFDTAFHEIEAVGEEAVSSIVAMAEQEIATVAPEAAAAVSEIVSSVASAISSFADAIPVLGAILGIVINIVEGMQPSASELQAAADRCKAMLSKAPIGSGYVPATKTSPARSGIVTPADIFAVDPSPEDGRYSDSPASSLGKAFVGVTEVSPPPDDADPSMVHLHEMLMDAPLYHTTWGYRAGEAAYRALTGDRKSGWMGPHRQAAYRALRRAMASQNADKGASLWPIYLAMLANDMDAGRLSGGLMVYLLGHYWNQPTETGEGPFGWVPDDPPYGPGPFCGSDAWTPYVDQIIGLVGQWNALQASKPSLQLAAHLAAVGWPAPLATVPTNHFMRAIIKLSFAKPASKLMLGKELVHLLASSSSSSSAEPGDGTAWTNAMAGALGLK